jgi:hypothetical protein
MGLLSKLFGSDPPPSPTRESLLRRAAAEEAEENEYRKAGVITDELPLGYGDFGLVASNPIPCKGSDGAKVYLDSLWVQRLNRSYRTRYRHLGTTRCEAVTPGPIGIYEISTTAVPARNEPAVAVCTIFISPYHLNNSSKLPSMLKHFDLSSGGAKNTVCLYCGTMRPLTQDNCGTCGRGYGPNDDGVRFRLSQIAFSDKHWSHQNRSENSSQIKNTGKPTAEAENLLSIYVHEEGLFGLRDSYKYRRYLPPFS